MAIRNTLRTIRSKNVVAKLEGSDPQLRDEYVVYTAHWDHLGIGAPVEGDDIYNGALDNASGVAAVLEIARAFEQRRAAAEALGAVPDGRRRGAGPARLAALRRAAALSAGEDAGQHQHRRRQPVGTHQGHHRHRPGRVGPRRLPARGGAPNRDARCGRTRNQRRASTTARITSTSPRRACRRSTRTPASTSSASPRSTASRSATSTPNKDYHAPSDQMKPDWDLTGAVDDAQLLFLVGYRVANAREVPGVEAGQRVQGDARRHAQNDRRTGVRPAQRSRYESKRLRSSRRCRSRSCSPQRRSPPLKPTSSTASSTATPSRTAA